VNDGIFIRNHMLCTKKRKSIYSLGARALPLISTWKTEELTKHIKWLTYLILFTTLVSIAINVRLSLM